MLNYVVLLEVLEGEGAAGWIRRGLDSYGEETDGYFGGEVDGGGCFDQGGLGD